MNIRNTVIIAGLVATIGVGASAAFVEQNALPGVSPRPVALQTDEGVPQNLVTAMKQDESVPQNLVTALKQDEGVPRNLVTAMKQDEGVPQNLVDA